MPVMFSGRGKISNGGGVPSRAKARAQLHVHLKWHLSLLFKEYALPTPGAHGWFMRSSPKEYALATL